MEYLVFPYVFVDEDGIVDIANSSQGFHVHENVDVDHVLKVEWKSTNFCRSDIKSFEPTLCMKLF